MGTHSFSSKVIGSIFLSGALLAGGAVSASAEVSNGPDLRGSLSQLEFDEGFVPAHKLKPAPAKSAEPLQTISPPTVTPLVIKQTTSPNQPPGEVKSAAKAKQSSKQIAKQNKNSSAREARAMLGINAISEQKLENQIIVPRLRGPFTDRGDSKKVKSILTWKPRKKAVCGLPLSGGELCNKARALKETLYRFSGNHDFFDSQCSGSCATPEESSVPQGLSIPDSSETSFRLVSEDGACHYELNKKSESNWQVMSPSKVSCVCLPASCFTN